jgi:2-methylcitrate dehydratase PrpD
MTAIELPKVAVAEHLARKICALDAARLPDAVRTKCRDLLVDVVGLAVTARHEDYVKSTLQACDDDGPCTAIGHARTLSAAAAALVNGTAIHGEDFDDTFEGGPIHAGAVIVPAVLAACERHGLDGRAALLGIAVGVETMCRLSLVAPTLTHKAGFHPTAVFGAMGAAAGVGAALKLTPAQLVDALGTAASMASGIIEYLAEGAWTKRLHAGWAAQSGLRAALLGRSGFVGPRTVFEGVHGFFHGFAHTTEVDYDALIGDFGTRWVMETLAFKAYPCGTMTHPYIDCARRLANHIILEGEVELTIKDEDGTLRREWRPEPRLITANDIVDIVCEVGEGTVHRLWEPLAAKQNPANGYAGKFSTPYCIAAGFVRGNVGLSDFSDAAVRDPVVLALAAKIRYEIDPKNPYPKNFTGHIRATLRQGYGAEERQPYMRGGVQAPLTRADVEEKFMLNAAHGGWSEDRAGAMLRQLGTMFDGLIDLAPLRG